MDNAPIPGAGTTTSLWQRNLVGLRAERWVGFATTGPNAVARFERRRMGSAMMAETIPQMADKVFKAISAIRPAEASAGHQPPRRDRRPACYRRCQARSAGSADGRRLSRRVATGIGLCRGSLCTDHGGMWFAERRTKARPGPKLGLGPVREARKHAAGRGRFGITGRKPTAAYTKPRVHSAPPSGPHTTEICELSLGSAGRQRSLRPGRTQCASGASTEGPAALKSAAYCRDPAKLTKNTRAFFDIVRANPLRELRQCGVNAGP